MLAVSELKRGEGQIWRLIMHLFCTHFTYKEQITIRDVEASNIETDFVYVGTSYCVNQLMT